ncbi:MAG: carbohydrate ABC transporter permease [Clostridiales bacterium]|nr:carbohydrate ABC transporter permease [Clostridiales bacterium]
MTLDKKKKIKKILFYVIISIIALLVIVPFLWMISTSLKGREALRTLPIRWIPKDITLDAYKEVINIPNFSFTRAVFNSFYLSIVTTFVSVMSSAMAAFIFAKIPFKGRNVLFSIFLATMMIPGSVTMIPNYIILKHLHLLNTFTGLIIPFIFNAFGVFLLRQHMASIDDAYFEAAAIDGASLVQIFFKVMLPLSKPALAVLAFFVFAGTWNSYLWPLIVLTDRAKYTLQLVLGTMSTRFGNYEHLLMAGSIISIIPIILAYIIIQHFLEEGLNLGGIEG